MSEPKKNSNEGLGWGLFLVGLGVVFLLVQQDLLPRHLLYRWWTWWPAVLIVIGLFKLIRPQGPDDIGGGVTMALFGVWFFANQFEWYGLGWGNSWPLALVAVGAGMIAKAIAQALTRGAGKEESRG